MRQDMTILFSLYLYIECCRYTYCVGNIYKKNMERKRKTVLVDMDGVLADVYRLFLDYHFRETGEKIDEKDIYGKLEYEAFPLFEKHVHLKGFFQHAPLMEDSQRALEVLNNKYNTIILSSATEFPLSLTEKQLWLLQNFPFISWRQVIFCGDKSYVKGDIMIDDHNKNLKNFDGTKILFTQPHNIFIEDSDYFRANSWQQVLDILEEIDRMEAY